MIPTKVIVNGALGKMGALACATLKAHPDFLLAAEVSRKGELREAIRSTKASIVVDLTRADTVFENSMCIIEEGAHPVIGTSGLLESQIQALTEYCQEKQLGGIIAPNFSIGAILLMRFAAIAAPYLSSVEIIEAHHPQKFDAPSGTSLKTAEMLAHARSTSPENPIEESIPGVRGGLHHGIRIHSLRLPGILAKQEVLFGNTGETLSITHNSLDRNCFMPGIVLCCQKVPSLTSLYYGLEHLL